MEAIAYSNARKKFAGIMEKVCNDHEPVIITRKNAPSVIMMSLDDYSAIEETMYLLKSPANAAHLMASIAEFECGKYKVMEIDDVDRMDESGLG